MMLSFKLQFKVLEITEDTIDVNGYKYRKINALIPGDINIDCYVLQNHLKRIAQGSYYSSQKAYVTCMDWAKDKSKEISIRADNVQSSNKDEFDATKETVVRINGRISRSNKNELRYKGPMMIPIFSTTLVVKNELGDLFFALIVGMNSKAKQLNELPSYCYVDITGTLSRRDPRRPCAILVNSIDSRKEVTL